MAKVLVKATLYRPTPPGDIPASGYIEARPSLRRDIDDAELDAVVLPARSKAKLGAALTYTDDADVEHTTAATPGVAWFWIDATDAGADANLWFWTFTERTDGGTRRYCTVPTSAVTVDYADLPDIDPDDYSVTPPAGTPAFAVADDALRTDLEAQIAAVEAGDVDSVAGLSGTVSAPGLKTALSLPDDTAAELAVQLAAINAEIVVREAEDLALQVDVDAKVPLTRTVNGHPLTGDVTVSKADVGLGSVDNTADADKPVSTLQAAADAAVLASIETEVADAAEVQLAGLELGFAERTTNFTTTSTGLGSFITGLEVTVVGSGRPVDIEFYCSAVRHSVANTLVGIYLDVNGSAAVTQSQAVQVASASTTAGRTAYLHRRTVLTNGVSYTFKVGVFSFAAGTATLNGSTAAAMELTVTSR